MSVDNICKMWILLVSTCTCMRSVGLLQRTLRSARENGARFITKDFTFIFRHIQDLIHRLWVAHPVFVTDQLKGERAGYRTCPLFCPATAPDEHPGKDERDVLPKKVRPRKHLIWKLVSGRYHTHARTQDNARLQTPHCFPTSSCPIQLFGQ